ncbi:MAG: J domain-containing protein [Lachnospiraceae bacterium]|nr:J domain-containing protein [Lachnospiraceae bacterium]MBQ3975101.1 J domain-containing protein [Lachnospiraceae bacterium]
MSGKKDYYAVLGLTKTADPAAIKKAYRKLAKKYHPDTNAGNAEAENRFKEVQEAYNVLSDEEKKKLYDKYGFDAYDEGTGTWREPFRGFGGGFGNGGFGGYQDIHFSSGGAGGFEDILRNFGFGGGGFGGGFGSAGGFGGRTGSYGASMPRDGANTTASINVTFDEAARGCEKTFSFRDGQGAAKNVRVKIPAGIDTGKKIRIAGKGAPGTGGGRTGDLMLEVNVLSKPGWERKGQDVYTTVHVPFSTAALGGEAMVETLDGRVACKVRPGSQSGSRIRLKGKGIPSMNNPSVKGDQYVTVEVEVPRNLSEAAKQKLREFEALL